MDLSIAPNLYLCPNSSMVSMVDVDVSDADFE